MRLRILVALVPLIGLCSSANSQSCSDECVRYILDDLSGPRVIRLVQELSTPDASNSPKVIIYIDIVVVVYMEYIWMYFFKLLIRFNVICRVYSTLKIECIVYRAVREHLYVML